MGTEDSGEGGFLSRWSRRKSQVRQGNDPGTRAPGDPVGPAAGTAAAAAGTTAASSATVTAATATHAPVSANANAAVAQASAASAGGADAMSCSAPGAGDGPASAIETASGAAPSAVQSDTVSAPRPTLNDVEQLGADSDYRSFVARDVDPQVRNAAFKKLFHSDPHFNVMDGLDVYIDDYNTPRPLSLAIMKTLVQARTLGLIDDELKDQDLPPPDAPASSNESAAGAGDSASGTEPETIQAAGAEGQQVLGVDDHPSAEPDSVDGHDMGHDMGSDKGSDMGPDGGSALMGQTGGGVLAQGSEEDGHQAMDGERSAEIVHVVHAVPLVAVSMAPVAVSAPPAASMATAAPGTVIPFPRRPGSADPA